VTRCAVIGAGAWGTAVANLLATNGRDVALWAREPDVVDEINGNHRNSRFLPGFDLHESLHADGDLASVVSAADVVVYVTPSPHLAGIASAAAQHLRRDCIVGVATKGLDPASRRLMTEVVEESASGRPIVALSGPSFAAEVAARQPTALVAASSDPRAAAMLQESLSNTYFRVYTQSDVTGVELGGALKNVMAVATGIAEGAGLGFNSRAALITRGLAEMTRLAVVMGGRAETLAGLAGLGDLVLTCTGALSRNRAVGMEIGRGVSLEESLGSRETVAEGVNTARTALALAQSRSVEMPIVRMVNRVLFEGYPPARGVDELMGRELRSESER
jgi:glycerol-3-phosphate dehydrogenase (NAD(P)+)